MFPVFEKIEFKNYKSFVRYSSLSQLKRINVFIGRNNSGKSSCIDVIQSLTENNKSLQNIDVNMDYKVSDIDYNLMFKKSEFINSGAKPSTQEVVNKIIKLCLNKQFIQGNKRSFEYNESNTIFSDFSEYGFDINNIITNINNGIAETKFYRLNAERNIVPEPEETEVVLSEDGTGASNVIHHILNYDKYNEKLVREDLLSALNEIMKYESEFKGITVQKTVGSLWEVFLYEGDYRFPLSKMGSGLKTVILVLLNLLVMPYISMYQTTTKENVDYKNMIFAFEELENNLHPALQRRLFDYIYKFSVDHNTTVLLTTHSHVAINIFANKDDVKLYHVIKENGASEIQEVDDYLTKCEILDDLDVRASDLFQSNGIIWVEGPSDRQYIKRWIELWGDKNLVEGVNYQFLYYGGKVLSHFTANPNLENDNLIKILSTNRNSAIVIDSDICGKRKGINNTKKRIKDEFENNKMFCWITTGKEIENYIPYQAINKGLNCKLTKQCEKNEKFPEYIKQVVGESAFNKVDFSQKVAKCIDNDNSEGILDLKQKVKELCDIIKQWNT